MVLAKLLGFINRLWLELSRVLIYAWVRETAGWQPGWNFNKVLIGRDGRIAGTFGSGDEPVGAKLTDAIAAALARKA